jgi:hypothetical protein
LEFQPRPGEPYPIPRHWQEEELQIGVEGPTPQLDLIFTQQRGPDLQQLIARVRQDSNFGMIMGKFLRRPERQSRDIVLNPQIRQELASFYIQNLRDTLEEGHYIVTHARGAGAGMHVFGTRFWLGRVDNLWRGEERDRRGYYIEGFGPVDFRVLLLLPCRLCYLSELLSSVLAAFCRYVGTKRLIKAGRPVDIALAAGKEGAAPVEG